MIYLDSSALVKLVREEPESATLQAWLDARSESILCSSALCRVEVPRAVAELGDDARSRAHDVLDDLVQLPLTEQILDAAGSLPGRLRSLDAIHLAAALRLRANLTAVVGYDRRLLDPAAAAGLPVTSPGAA